MEARRRCNRKRNRGGCNNVMILWRIGRNKPARNPLFTTWPLSLLILALLTAPPLFDLSLLCLLSPPPMPHSSKSHKAEAKFNVTTECAFHIRLDDLVL